MSETNRSCIGCHVTDEEIERLKLTQHFDLPFFLDDGSQEYLCTKCQNDAGVLGTVIAEKLATWSATGPRGRSAVAGLFGMRDVMLRASIMAPVVEEMQGFKLAWQAALDHHHEAIDECRQVLGLDAMKKKSLTRQKLGVFGAVAGALLGYGIFSARNPLEMLRMAVEKVSEALKQYGVTDGPPVPEDAPLS